MGVPKQVEEAGKNAEALQKELNEGPASGQQPPADPGQQQPPVNPQQQADPSQNGQQGQQPPNPNVHQQPPQNAQPQNNQQQPGQEDWQQKYASLQGMYNSQVPKLQADVTRLQESVDALLSENEQLKEAAQKKNQPDPNGDGEVQKLNKEDLAQYGEEFGNLVDAFNQLQESFARSQDENKSLKDQLTELNSNVTESQQAAEINANNSYMEKVKEGIKELGADFEVLNFDHNFLNWLRQIPLGDVETRHDKLRRAQQSRDLTATLAIWSEYIKPDTPADPGPQPNNPNIPPGQPQQFQQQQYQQPGAQPPPGQQPPNLQPNPTQTGTDIQPPAQQQARMWTRKDIGQFYTDLSAGKFRGREDEAKAIEADIDAAQVQGRVIG